MPVTRATRRPPRAQRRDEDEEDEGARQEEEEEEEQEDGVDSDDDDKQKKAARGGGRASSSSSSRSSSRAPSESDGSSRKKKKPTPTTTSSTSSSSISNGKPLIGHRSSSSSSSSLLSLVGGILLLGALLIGTAFYLYIFPHAQRIDYRKTKMNPARLHKHCQEQVGEPRVEEVTEGVFIAMGYDLANTILIRTSEGHVVVRWEGGREGGMAGATERHDVLTPPSLPPSLLQVDVSVKLERATLVRRVLEAAAGKAFIHSIIYARSHIDPSLPPSRPPSLRWT